MYSRPYTTLNRITIEAVDCTMNYNNINGHLTITLEPSTPVYPVNRVFNPLLSQASRSPPPRPQTFSLPLNANTMNANVSNRSTPMTVTTTTQDIVQNNLTLGDTASSPISPSLSPANTMQYVLSTTPIPEPQTQEPEETPAPSSPTIDNDDTNFQEIPIRPKEIPLDKEPTPPPPPQVSSQEPKVTNDPKQSKDTESLTTQVASTTDNPIPFEFSSYVKSSSFQNQMKKVLFQVPNKTFEKIAKNPQKMKDCILQIMNRYPDLLDDNPSTILQYISTPQGQVQINQPALAPQTVSSNNQPLDNTEHDQSNVKEVVPSPLGHDPPTPPELNDKSPTIPRSLSPENDLSQIYPSDPESEDCVIQRVSPPTQKQILHQRSLQFKSTSSHIIKKGDSTLSQ